VARKREERNAHTVLVGKPEEKRPLGSYRRRSENNIRINPKGEGRQGVDWLDVFQGKD
jgi:hypothetical protein